MDGDYSLRPRARTSSTTCRITTIDNASRDADKVVVEEGVSRSREVAEEEAKVVLSDELLLKMRLRPHLWPGFNVIGVRSVSPTLYLLRIRPVPRTILRQGFVDNFRLERKNMQNRQAKTHLATYLP